MQDNNFYWKYDISPTNLRVELKVKYLKNTQNLAKTEAP